MQRLWGADYRYKSSSWRTHAILHTQMVCCNMQRRPASISRNPNGSRGRQSLKFHSMLGAQLQCHSPPSRHPTARKHPNFEAYDDALLRQAIHAGESFTECSTSGCRGGGWVDSTSNITYFVCDVCYQATCIEHNGPYATHAGKPCPATASRRAQTERERERREKEDRASEELLKKTAQLGPCGHWVSKTEGCDHMTCTCFPHLFFSFSFLSL